MIIEKQKMEEKNNQYLSLKHSKIALCFHNRLLDLCRVCQTFVVSKSISCAPQCVVSETFGISLYMWENIMEHVPFEESMLTLKVKLIAKVWGFIGGAQQYTVYTHHTEISESTINNMESNSWNARQYETYKATCKVAHMTIWFYISPSPEYTIYLIEYIDWSFCDMADDVNIRKFLNNISRTRTLYLPVNVFTFD